MNKGLWIQLENILCNYIDFSLMIISKFGHPFKVMMEMHLLILHAFIEVCLVPSFVIIDLNYVTGHKNSSFFLISSIFNPFLNYFSIHFHVCYSLLKFCKNNICAYQGRGKHILSLKLNMEVFQEVLKPYLSSLLGMPKMSLNLDPNFPLPKRQWIFLDYE